MKAGYFNLITIPSLAYYPALVKPLAFMALAHWAPAQNGGLVVKRCG